MKNKKLIVLAIPVLMMIGWVLMLQYQLSNGKEVRLKITGYDPRDILSGHYLRYNVDFGKQITCNDDIPYSCICLSLAEGEKFHTGFIAEDCSEIRSNCATMIKGHCQYGIFSTAIERYYIPEKYSSALQTLPEDGSITVSLDTEGNALVKEMFIGNESLIEFAEKNLNTPR